VTPVVVLLVLAAAGLHAGWNVLLKTSGDPLPTSTRALAASAVVVTPICLVAWYVTGHPGLPAVGWVVLAASACAEGLYFVFLSRAYQAGDLSVVYPVARGTGPLVAVTAGLLVLHEHLTAVELAGVLALLGGIWAVRRPRMNAAVIPALITGVFIGVYTTLDRVGVNLGSPWLYGGLLWGLMAVVLAVWDAGPAARPQRRRKLADVDHHRRAHGECLRPRAGRVDPRAGCDSGSAPGVGDRAGDRLGGLAIEGAGGDGAADRRRRRDRGRHRPDRRLS